MPRPATTALPGVFRNLAKVAAMNPVRLSAAPESYV